MKIKHFMVVLLGAAITLPFLAAEAQRPLRQSTERLVRICGVVAVGDGFTPVTTLALSTADEAEALRENTATLDISGATWAAVTGADGCYSLTLSTTATNTVGELLIAINDDSLVLPIFEDFYVYEEAVFDRDFPASATGIIGTAQTGDSYARLGAPAGASVSADIAGLPTDADVNAQADLALADIHLDHLFATTYDPASKPGTADALLNEMVESDAGVSRFTANALEQGPSGGGSFAAADLGYHTTTIATLASQTSMTLTAGSADNGAYDGYAAIFIDQSTSTQQGLSIAGCTTPYVGTSRTLTLEAAPEFTIATGDNVILAPAFMCDGVAVSSLGDNVITAASTAADYAAEINATVDTALSDYDAVVPADLPTNFGDLSITATTGRVDVAAVGGTAQTANDNGADINAILVDTNELQGDWANGGRLDNILDARASQTSVDGVPTNAEFEARTLAAAAYATATAVSDVHTDVLANRTQLFQGTADSGTTTSMVDANLTAAFASNDLLNGRYVVRSDGQACFADDYVAASGTIDFGACAFTGAWSTQTYDIYPAGTQ